MVLFNNDQNISILKCRVRIKPNSSHTPCITAHAHYKGAAAGSIEIEHIPNRAEAENKHYLNLMPYGSYKRSVVSYFFT